MERLKELRINAHMTQKMMADYLQIDRTTYVKYEKGLSEPNFATIIRIADYFNVSVDYLIGHNSDHHIYDDKEKQPAAIGSELDEALISEVNMFAERLRQLRKERGLTQMQLAAIINVERSSIGKYEGKSMVIPSDDVKRRIAEYFDVSVDYLLGRTDIRNAEKIEKPAASGSELDEALISLLCDLTPSELQRVQDFALGLKASREV